jgi:hypothetical protein
VLTLEFDSATALHRIHVIFDGGAGEDTLRGTTGDTAWTISGANSGFADAVSFSNVENLRGAANNDDTFTLLAGGSLSGVLDGGAGGFDTLILGGGTFGSIVYTATGPQSGTIARDTDVVSYVGLEPIVDNTVTANRVITTSDLTDNARLSDLGTQLKLESVGVPTFESITFAKPTNSLTVDLGGDLGIPLTADQLEIQTLTLNADLIVNGQAGQDAVTITGDLDLGGNPLTVNAEQITVNPGVAVNAGNITLNAVAADGTLGTPDTLPLANVAADVDINGATLNGNDINLTASAALVSSVTNPLPNVPTAALAANLSAEVNVHGNSTINAAGLFSAHAESNVNSTVVAAPATGALGEIAIAAPVINTTARSHLSDNASVSAGGTVTLDATTNTVVSAKADGIAATTQVGTTTAAPVIVATAEAFIADSAHVTQSDSIDIDATATGTLTTLANSTPAGATLNPATLATLGIATAAGPQTDAAAIAATSLTSKTRAFVDTTGALTSGGALSLLASSDFDVNTTANATPTVSANNNGFAVAVNLTQITDEAFVDGTPSITATALNIHTDGGSHFSALAQSGAAGLNNADQGINAGAFALNTNIPSLGPTQGNLSHAYIGGNAVVTLTGNFDVNIGAKNTTIVDVNAQPQGAATSAVQQGVGRSVGANISAYTTLASIDSNAQLIGARNLSVTADGDQTARVTALAGALAGDDASAQTVAAQVTGNASLVLIDVGAAMALSGTLTARSNHKATNIIRASSDAAAAQKTTGTASLALPMAVNLANDVATTTISGTVSTNGAATISADATVRNQAEGVAGVQGADPNNTTAASLVSDELAFLANRANLSFGSSPKPPATDPDVDVNNLFGLAANQTQGKAAAIGVNLSNALSNAAIASTGTVTANNGALSVVATSDVDSNALASASAVLNLVGIAAGIAVNAQQSDTIASIAGNATGDSIEVRTGFSGDGVQTLRADSTSGTGIQVAGVSGRGRGHAGARQQQRIHRQRRDPHAHPQRRSDRASGCIAEQHGECRAARRCRHNAWGRRIVRAQCGHLQNHRRDPRREHHRRARRVGDRERHVPERCRRARGRIGGFWSGCGCRRADQQQHHHGGSHRQHEHVHHHRRSDSHRHAHGTRDARSGCDHQRVGRGHRRRAGDRRDAGRGAGVRRQQHERRRCCERVRGHDDIHGRECARQLGRHGRQRCDRGIQDGSDHGEGVRGAAPGLRHRSDRRRQRCRRYDHDHRAWSGDGRHARVQQGQGR